MKLKNVILIIICAFLNLPVFAKHSDIFISSCSDIIKQDIYYTQHIMEIQGYQLPLTISCDEKSAENAYNLRPIGNIKFSNVNALSFIYPADVYDSIFIREQPVNMTFSRAFTHELGHYNHVLKVGYNKFQLLKSQKIPEDIKPIISKNMKEYANTSKTEFVAEYFSYSQLGYELPKKLKKFYKECGGP